MDGRNSAMPETVDILLVDDRRSNLVALEAILSSPDYNLVMAQSGAEALKHVLRQDFAVILLDVMMPEMDGFECARLVRQRASSKSTPIIFLTAIAKDSRYQQEGYAIGAVDYLHKPLDADIVKAKVAVFVDLYRKGEQIKRQEARLREADRREQELRLLELRRESEQHYRELAEAIPQIVWIAKPTGQLMYLTQRWATLTGHSWREGGTWRELEPYFHHDDFEPFYKHWQECLASGNVFEFECRLKQHDSSEYQWHLCQALPERNSHQEIVNWLGTFTDINSQKRVEQAQRLLVDTSSVLASATDYRVGLLEALKLAVREIPDLAIVDLLDADGLVQRRVVCGDELENTDLVKSLSRPTLSCLEAAEWFAKGLTAEEGVLQTQLDANEVRAMFERAQLSCDPVPQSAMSVPLRGRNKVIGAVTVIKTGGKRFDQFDLDMLSTFGRHASVSIENARTYEEVQRANRAKDEFLAVLSHELRTPLSAMIGWSQYLKTSVKDETVLQGLSVIERNGDALAQLVSDILDVSRIVAGKLSINRKSIELQSFLTSAWESVQPLADARSIVIKADLSAVKNAVVMGDPDRLRQVFWNLLTNAIKFSAVDGTVEVQTALQGDSVLVTVKDYGVGIEPQFLPRLFHRFSQSDSSTTRKHSGLGLGLAIVKSLAELHGGSVTAESAGLGLGASFSVRLPVVIRTAPKGRKTSPTFNPDINLKGVSVVVVDDDQPAREIAVAFLKRSGAQVRAVGSVREAMAEIRQEEPDVVITDIGMPEEDGFDLLKQVKTLAANPKHAIPVAALTAYASSEDAARALAAGFDMHFSKPFKFEELLTAITRLSRRRDRLEHQSHDSHSLN